MLHLNFTPFPVLITERLVLRQLQPGDTPEIFFLRSDEQVLKYVKRPPCQSHDEAAAFIERINKAVANNESIFWGITLKENDRLIGNMCIWNIEPENYRAEIGYVLHPDHFGKGIMTEALAAAVEYGFKVINLHSFGANTAPENIASQRVLEKNGFIQEGYFRENFYYEGKFLDSAVYSLLSPYK